MKTEKTIIIKIYEFLVSTEDKSVKLTILHAYFHGLTVVAWSPVLSSLMKLIPRLSEKRYYNQSSISMGTSLRHSMTGAAHLLFCSRLFMHYCAARENMEKYKINSSLREFAISLGDST